jgi:GGDEF domain-containing protein
LINYFVAELQSRLATAELIARYSSNSFMVIIPSNDPVMLQALVQKMASAFKSSVAISGKLTLCKWSFGFSEYPKSGTNSRNLIRAAQRVRYTSGEEHQEAALEVV